MIIISPNKQLNKREVLKYSALSAGLTAGIGTISAVRQYVKTKPVAKDLFIKEAGHSILSNSYKNALITTGLCVGFGILNRIIINNKKENKI